MWFRDKNTTKILKRTNKKEHLLQEWALLLCRKLLMISSGKRRHAKKGTVTLLLHLLKALHIFLPLIRCNFSSSTKLALKRKIA